MKKIIFIGLLVLMISCADNKFKTYRDAPTQFVIVDIEDKKGMKGMSTYYVEVIDVNDLSYDHNNTSSNLKFWFCDTIKKYKLGQPIHFDKTR